LHGVGNVLQFPLHRVCALGVPPEVISEVREMLANVNVSVDAASIQRADLLVIGEFEPRASEFVRWVRAMSPNFPVLTWTSDTPTTALAERCRRLLA
jgi:hypothetical protein